MAEPVVIPPVTPSEPVVAPVEPIAAIIEPSIEEREAQITLKENTIAAKEAFRESGIPEGLLPFVVNGNGAMQKKNIEALTDVWNASLKAAMEGKLKGKVPEITPPPTNTKKWDDMSYGERKALHRSNPALYAQIRDGK